MQEDKNAIFQMRFPQKLWYLLNLRTDAILWGGTGRTILLNYRVLHSYLQCDHSIFKTTNISSFVRQLNLYGFRKVTSHLQDPLCNSSNPYMHEYVHDYFQFGRPELLNKINRKALTIKKNYKPKLSQLLFSDEQISECMTPLQKARRGFQIALQKAAQDIFFENSATTFQFDCEDAPNEFCDEDDNVELDCQFPTPGCTNQPPLQSELSLTVPSAPALPMQETAQEIMELPRQQTICSFEYNNEDSLLNFNDESSQQNNDGFPNQFLSMPELDVTAEPEANGAVELLAQFDINDDIDDGIARRIRENNTQEGTYGLNSLNCVLPSISNDQIDYVSMVERETEYSAHYHGEWDQMFNEMIANRGPIQECGSDLKELYSQISKTIDLLNS